MFDFITKGIQKLVGTKSERDVKRFVALCRQNKRRV